MRYIFGILIIIAVFFIAYDCIFYEGYNRGLESVGWTKIELEKEKSTFIGNIEFMN